MHCAIFPGVTADATRLGLTLVQHFVVLGVKLMQKLSLSVFNVEIIYNYLAAYGAAPLH